MDGGWVAATTAGIGTTLGWTSADLGEVVELLLAALDSSFALQAPALLADQLDWQDVRLVALAVPEADQERLLEVAVAALSEALDPGIREALAGHVGRAHGLLAEHRAARESVRSAGLVLPLSELPARYVELVLAGRRAEATELVLRVVRDGADVGEILVDVLQVAQVEIGRRWQRGELSVVQEHYFTAVTQLVMSQLYPFLFTGRDSGRRLVAACVAGDKHEVGLRMVTDLLERAGWNTAYLGADVPARGLADLLTDRRADVLLLSASMPAQLGDLRRTIETVRADPRCDHVRILVGGRPFLVAPALADAFGADGCAADARAAVAICDRLTGGAVARV